MAFNFLTSTYREFVDFLLTRNSFKFWSREVEHGLIGLQSEVGEIADLFKKYQYYRAVTDQNQIHELHKKMIDECGDCLFYLQALLLGVHSDIDQAIAVNRAKLTLRHGGGWDGEQHFNKDRVAEQEAIDIALAKAVAS